MKTVCFVINLYNHQKNKDTKIQFHPPEKARLGIRGNKRKTNFFSIHFFCCSWLMEMTYKKRRKHFVNHIDNFSEELKDFVN